MIFPHNPRADSVDTDVPVSSCGMTRQERYKKIPDTHFCEMKYRLTVNFVAANHELMELQNQQTQAVIDQDPDFARFDDLIYMAKKKKDEYALIAHAGGHLC